MGHLEGSIKVTNDVRHVSLRWLERIDPQAAAAIVSLIDCTVEDDGVLGFTQAMSAGQAREFCVGLQAAIDRGCGHALLGESVDGPACFVMMTRSAMPNCRHLAELTKGVVHPHMLGHGLIPQLFHEIVLRARQLGIERLTLDVRENTRAHKLWGRMGFVSFGVLEDYARVGETSHRGHYMTQRVSDLAARLALD